MLYFIIAGISGFALAASIIALKRIFFELIELSVSLTNEVLSKEDESIKQKKLIGALKHILVSLLKTTIAFVIITGVTILPLYLYSLFTKENFEGLDFSSIWFILSLSLGSVIPFFLFKKKKNDDNYSEASKLFHRLILNNYNLSKLLFSFDKKFKKGEKITEKSDFVIVSGLARAGTTSLTDQLFKAGKFSSLDYSNMPLLLAPNLWKKLYNPKNTELKERKHGDKMMFGLNTIEALEEYFFKVFLNDSFIGDAILIKHDISQEIYEKYLAYQSLIRSDNSHLYLSKNNNLILRYPSLRALNKNFKAIFLFRNPVEHADSLLNQHLRFSDFQHDDDFIETYMDWLGHHEFGHNQKVFSFDNKPVEIEYDKGTLDYWLSVWLNYYSYLLTLDDSAITLIDYQDYLSNPKDVLVHLQNELKMDFDLSNVKPFNNNKTIDTSGCNKILLDETEKVYSQLKQKKATF
tara:strand:+ start:3848 stop:5239 length:1392 start_codon:yes stop_codon:yes gene_type:complete